LKGGISQAFTVFFNEVLVGGDGKGIKMVLIYSKTDSFSIIKEINNTLCVYFVQTINIYELEKRAKNHGLKVNG